MNDIIKYIEDLELVTDSSREQLNVNANKMGSVAGHVVVVDKGDSIDWSKLGSGGWSVPSNVEGYLVACDKIRRRIFDGIVVGL